MDTKSEDERKDGWTNFHLVNLHTRTENMEKRWESSISQSISVPAGQYYLVAVEMAMYPFIKEQ